MFCSLAFHGFFQLFFISLYLEREWVIYRLHVCGSLRGDTVFLTSLLLIVRKMRRVRFLFWFWPDSSPIDFIVSAIKTMGNVLMERRLQ